MSLTGEANKRGCYCSVWDDDPKVFEKMNLPRGFCGACQWCGKPGHARHFPGGVPYSGAWCDRHYLITRLIHPLAVPGNFVWLFAVLLIGFIIWKLFSWKLS